MKFWTIDTLNEEWKEIQVPGEYTMQGISIKHDIPFVYKKRIDIPGDYDGKEIILQFDGIYSYARIWVNGEYVRDHSGGFTRWRCDITPFVEAGKTAMLTVEVTDKADEISFASGYAKHLIGGILRDVKLLAFPGNYPVDITISTDFDENFEHAALVFSGNTKNPSHDSKINIELFDRNNQKINLDNSSISLDDEQGFLILNQIRKPQKWNAEHPYLYSLKVSFFENDRLLLHKVYQVGFREITIDGNKLLVNGKKVKLRGANRHDIHPLLGRVSTPEYELKDVLLAKEANINFIRTSHYPPTENFLQLCDEYGLYVEDETAVCFVHPHRKDEYAPGDSQDNLGFTDRYLSQLEEMVANHKNHPSIIIWSIGNENYFGSNFKKSYDWVKAYDTTRPVIFSYPGHVPDTVKAYDILSIHYPGISGNVNQRGKITKEFGYEEMPVLFDEWAHVACYNKFTLNEDQNIRSFWGISIDSLWQKTFEADGGLGGAIWCLIDEVFTLPHSDSDTIQQKDLISEKQEGISNVVGYGEWGIVDNWRRKKPEFWITKKSFSPVKLLTTNFELPTDTTIIFLPIYNRYDHTNLNEIHAFITIDGVTKELEMASITPHTKDSIVVSTEGWNQTTEVILEFKDKRDQVIDNLN